MHVRHRPANLIELLTVLLEIRLSWQRVDLVLDVRDSISGIGVIAEELRSAAAAFLFKLCEEPRQFDRVIACVVHHVGAEQIGLFLRLPRVLQKIGARYE